MSRSHNPQVQVQRAAPHTVCPAERGAEMWFLLYLIIVPHHKGLWTHRLATEARGVSLRFIRSQVSGARRAQVHTLQTQITVICGGVCDDTVPDRSPCFPTDTYMYTWQEAHQCGVCDTYHSPKYIIKLLMPAHLPAQTTHWLPSPSRVFGGRMKSTTLRPKKGRLARSMRASLS